MSRHGRRLAPEEAALWNRVISTVQPLHTDPRPAAMPEPLPEPTTEPPRARRKGRIPEPRPAAPPVPPRRAIPAQATLDAGWDRRLSRGLVAPDCSIDLHGHTLDSAYGRLDRGLEFAIARGDRVLLLITGKPPRPESERPHARGAIRAAVKDWLAASRHADRIAAVRGAHPRHGGQGALYIVLRRHRTAVPPKS
ncbi:Smr/MutS family protein [Stakelama tenebrarum]|uniref:DNA mismatch repair protein MutS n=1 Tax=Stakelama tenebrarum TaxID=2711215 RepID=A0A6G6Y4S9_9SPHN|nr:Smr/MutS family protein [Sphingosinithalassobacter tenebrarum]QIG79576.1 DNA mismatch repair protein MutS [Sphingosinithalassobacter tenebrarum]